jgi:hypothetical protein
MRATATAGERVTGVGRWLRRVLATVITALAISVCVTTAASAATIVTVSPTTVNAGMQVSIHAMCDDLSKPAFVNSAAFGAVTLVPNTGALSAQVTVPSTTRSGKYSVTLSCSNGHNASTSLQVVGRGGATTTPPSPNPTVGPQTGGGEMAANMGGKLLFYGGILAVVVGLALWLGLGVWRRAAR